MWGQLRPVERRPVERGPRNHPQNSLQGPYQCQYCKSPHAQWRRFGIPVCNASGTGIEYKGSFCTPECCAAHNKYLSKDAGTDQCANRHQLIETTYGRTVVPAPSKRVLVLQDISRAQWLPKVRAELSAEEVQLIMEKEMPLLPNDPSRPRAAQKKK